MLLITNTTSTAVPVNDLGLSLAADEIVNLSLTTNPRDVSASARPGGDLHSLIVNEIVTVRHPRNFTQTLSPEEGVVALQNHNTGYYGLPLGSSIADATDVDLTGVGEFLKLTNGVVTTETLDTFRSSLNLVDHAQGIYNNGQNVQQITTDTIIDFPVAILQDTIYAFESGILTINRTGLFEVAYDLTIAAIGTAATPVETQSVILLDDTPVPGLISFAQHHPTVRHGRTSSSFAVAAVEGQTLKLQVSQLDNTAGVVLSTVVEACKLTIRSLR